VPRLDASNLGIPRSPYHHGRQSTAKSHEQTAGRRRGGLPSRKETIRIGHLTPLTGFLGI